MDFFVHSNMGISPQTISQFTARHNMATTDLAICVTGNPFWLWLLWNLCAFWVNEWNLWYYMCSQFLIYCLVFAKFTRPSGRFTGFVWWTHAHFFDVVSCKNWHAMISGVFLIWLKGGSYYHLCVWEYDELLQWRMPQAVQ